jgi:thymidylate synthase ThyX
VFSQIKTHKIGIAINAKSFRYTSPKTVKDFAPIELREKALNKKQGSLDNVVEGADKLEAIVTQSQQAALDVYNCLLLSGVAPECARDVLPTSLNTTFVMTGSIQALLNFILLRDAPDAQKEIRLVAQEIRKHMNEAYPATMDVFSAYVEEYQEMIARLRLRKKQLLHQALNNYSYEKHGWEDKYKKHEASPIKGIVIDSYKMQVIEATKETWEDIKLKYYVGNAQEMYEWLQNNQGIILQSLHKATIKVDGNNTMYMLDHTGKPFSLYGNLHEGMWAMLHRGRIYVLSDEAYRNLNLRKGTQ